ncbi:hypothetical protein T484DRAFT_1788792 [Baffinella frigidus]|nr:hypothetical protein T484DRAFT_1788792 [Cryptophyta sp. CCMP2293]
MACSPTGHVMATSLNADMLIWGVAFKPGAQCTDAFKPVAFKPVAPGSSGLPRERTALAVARMHGKNASQGRDHEAVDEKVRIEIHKMQVEMASKTAQVAAVLQAERERFLETSDIAHHQEESVDAVVEERLETPSAIKIGRVSSVDNLSRKHTVHGFTANGNTALQIVNESKPDLGTIATCRSGYSAVISHREELKFGSYQWKMTLDQSSTRAAEAENTFSICVAWGEVSLNKTGIKVRP